ncbi:MAG TPA: methyl-accepting chemotaxis protein, partial [Mycobacteriales bacterium]|nr:methyl-accepting chemotaxis protein [Mycobacteriales bacterium]
MDFSKRLARVAAIATWGALVLAVAAATVIDRSDTSRLEVDLSAVYLWALFGAVDAFLLTILPTLQKNVPAIHRSINVWRVVLLAGDMVFVTGTVAATGGIDGPFWLLYFPIVLFAAVSMPAVQSALFGLAATAGVVGASALADTLDRDSLGPLLVIGPLFPAAAWFNSSLSSAVWRMRKAAKEERDALHARVAELSTVLEQAARGDLAVNLDSGADADDSAYAKPISLLSSSFNHTLGNLRNLVAQIRGGGEQIAASAGELLATAEEHAVSATEQSSAVTQTTSTIEELAATAAQIADTAEAVA